MKEKKVIGLDKEGWREEDSHCRFSSNSRQKLSATLEPAACLCNPRFLRASMFFWLARNVRLAAYSGEKKISPYSFHKGEKRIPPFFKMENDRFEYFRIEFYKCVHRKRERKREIFN